MRSGDQLLIFRSIEIFLKRSQESVQDMDRSQKLGILYEVELKIG